MASAIPESILVDVGPARVSADLYGEAGPLVVCLPGADGGIERFAPLAAGLVQGFMWADLAPWEATVEASKPFWHVRSVAGSMIPSTNRSPARSGA